MLKFSAEALKAQRKACGLSQTQLADKIGASVRTYQKWESGESEPRATYYIRILFVLGLQETPYRLGRFESDG